MLLACESTVRNQVLKAIYDDLRHGAGQLSRTRPSLIACQLEDIYDEDWDQLTGDTGLAVMSMRLLRSSDRKHVNYVVYSSNKTPPTKTIGVTSFSATNLKFENKNAVHSFPREFFQVDS